MANLYALLVGINDYPQPVPCLRGCVNDVEMLAGYLQERVTTEQLELHVRTLKNAEATREAIIQAFREHLGQAQAEDSVLFAYSGHGSQEDAPPELWHLEPDRLNETLVCWDSRLENSRDLADKELGKLIAEVAEKGPKITVILDCCHSGSGSRPLNTRYVEPDRRRRPIESYLWTQAAETRSAEATLSAVPQGRHVLLAACRDLETAKENFAKKRGAFSYYLLETLSQAAGNLSCREVFKRTHALITAQVPNQIPQLEATDPDDLDLPFLGIGAAASNQNRHAYFTVSYNQDYGWVIDAGELHGIPAPTPQETTQLALFPFDHADPHSLSDAIGAASVVEVLPQLSRIHITGLPSLREDEVYRAIATSMPLAPVGVVLTGDEAGVALLQERLERASLYLTHVTDPVEAKFKVHAGHGRYQILDAVGEQALVRDLVGFSGAIADKVIERLEHIARWITVADLNRSPHSRIPANAIQLDILQDGQVLEDAPILLAYQRSGTHWQQPTFQVRLTNTSDLPLYCALLDLTERYAISPVGFEAGGVWLQPGETAWANGGKLLYASVPKELWQQGVTEYRDIFKLVVCTAEFDARLMAQGNLDAPLTRSVPSANVRPSNLNRLLRRVQQRDIGAEPEDDMVLDDWSTTQVTVVTVRPQEAQAIAPSGRAISLGADVQLHPHTGLQATARLTSLPEATRSLAQPTLPLIFNQDSAEAERLYFTRSRGSDPGLSVLELEVIDPDSLQTVTPTHPLRLTLPMPLGEGEYILPIAYDGEFFLPLGRSRSTAEGTDILLERLPESSTAAERSLQSTVRIFFQKLLSNKLGLAFEYPQLSAIYLLENGQVVYEKEPATLRPQIAEAQRILLLIHGLMGDTPNLINDLRSGTEMGAWLRDRYDLILGLDYESFNTSVEETARQLKLRLEAVGLHANHPKHLDVIGFELGGLIGRWLVEREGGHDMVSHLVLVGAPGAGTPWSTVQGWVSTALAVGLNSLSTVAWPVKVIGSLVAAMEMFDVTLDQMQPGSELLKSLEASPNPHIPYSIIAGNAALKSSALVTDSKGSSLVQRLVNKLTGGAASLAFLGQPNDLFASAHSLKAIALALDPAPVIQVVACDHFTYFTADQAQAAIKQVLTK
ncbi:caspase family protein [Halomicronema sp. CCY15110]|uniref:caspase family protein n=1 Tax=Halomicronema sp. CCY15110 TaxID=2767773 RepID=UPI00195151A0|nr:caspase family protein [Halomicronema sp. CCY15110]